MSRWWNTLNDADRSSLVRLAALAALVWVAAVAASMVNGCTSVETRDDPPLGCTDSPILKSIPNPGLASAAALIAVTELVRAYPEAREPVVRASRAAMNCLEDGEITYADLARVVAEQDELLMSELGRRGALYLELLIPLTGVHGVELPISQCDRDFLMEHFTKQLRLLGECEVPK